jgi:membrane protease YdiL (CAAX protease family)
VIQRLIADRPVAAFLAMVYAVNIAVALVPPLTRRDLLPFGQAPYDWLGHIVGCAVPAFVVMGALGGRAGVRDLAHRSFRWRVGARWYALALLGIPVATGLVAVASLGSAPIAQLAETWPLLVTTVLPHLLLIIVFSNVAEEIGWTGFLLARLQDRFSPLRASAIVAVPFALFHLPGWFVEYGPTIEVVIVTAALFVPQLCSRILAAWLYNGSGRSALIVGLFHCSFNVTSAQVAPKLFGLTNEDTFVMSSIVVILAAVAVAAITRGRLAYRPSVAAASPAPTV